MHHEMEFWVAIDMLLAEIEAGLTGQEVSELAQAVAPLANGPRNSDALDEAMAIIMASPEADNTMFRLAHAARGMTHMAGDMTCPIPGCVYACPTDPSHYQRWIRTAGPTPMCPDHHTVLVPRDSLLGKA
jgi:hypothetical protein